MKPILTLFLFFSLLNAWSQSCEYGNCKTGTGLFIYENGDRYEGRFREGLRHGKGKLTRVDGTTYDGNWKFDKKHGIGKLTFVDDSYYEGQWVYDFKEGLGTEEDANGEKYEGYFVAGHREGHGKFLWLDGSFYEGNWDNNHIYGIGSKYYPDHSHYEGEFVDGERDGYGILYDANKQVTHIGVWNADAYSEERAEDIVYRELFEAQQQKGTDEFSVSEIYNKDAPAVFTILSKDSLGTRIKGAGVFLTLDGIALCPLNLINQDTSQVFVVQNNTLPLDTIIYTNPILNYAIIKLKTDTLTHFAEVTKTPPLKNESIYIVGPTIAFQNTIDPGVIETVSTESFLYITYDAKTKLNNGSAVFNNEGELIGITLLKPAFPNKKIVLNLSQLVIPGLDDENKSAEK